MSGIEIFNVEQGTPEWFECRMGIPTASRFKDVMSKGRSKNAPSKTRANYMMELAAERITGQPMSSFHTKHTDRGNILEADALNAYTFLTDIEPELVGFVRNGRKGASPDAFASTNGQVEIKTKLPDLHLSALLNNTLPVEHINQVMGQLWVTEREWCDFVSYWPGLPLMVLRVNRDETAISEIKKAVDQFNDELDALVYKIETDYL